MLKLLVEDTIAAFPYQLLLPLFGNRLLGANGNKNMKIAINDAGDNTVVLVDVSPDNLESVRAYETALNASKSFKNVFVIPYPCIEYCFIRAFFGYLNKDMEVVLTFADYSKHVYNVIRKQLNTSNYEKFCKSVVKLYKKCMRNNDYVTKSCLCEKPMDEWCHSLTVDIKSFKLLYELPIFLLGNDDTEQLRNRVSAAISKGEDIYYKMGSQFVNHGIIETIKRLPSNII